MIIWQRAKKAIEKGLAPQISRHGKVSHKQYAMYNAVCELDRRQGYGNQMDCSPASASFHDTRLPVEWERGR